MENSLKIEKFQRALNDDDFDTLLDSIKDLEAFFEAISLRAEFKEIGEKLLATLPFFKNFSKSFLKNSFTKIIKSR